MKKHNFNPGPAVLPDVVLQETSQSMIDFQGTGMSVATISHRSSEAKVLVEETESLFKEILNVPEGYSVIFTGGGASLHFAMIPLNLMKTKAAYLNTGSWSKKAIKEAKMYGEVVEIAGADFNSIPKNFEVPSDVDYLHTTSNNTIFGTEIFEDYDFGVPLISDMSSNIMSRPIDVSKYAIMYGGAQKNLGPSGIAFACIREDILGKVDRLIPSYLNYKSHIDAQSAYNTTPMVPIYMLNRTLHWVKNSGGVKAMAQINKDKAALLYNEIDSNPLFKATVTVKGDRSLMNATFVMTEEYKALEKEFLALATSKGIVGIKGHRSVGGFRASIYNALPTESVQVLVDAMKEFAQAKG